MLAGINLDTGNVRMKPFYHKFQNQLPLEVQKYIYIPKDQNQSQILNVGKGTLFEKQLDKYTHIYYI